MSAMVKCAICGKPNDGSGFLNGKGGLDHAHCYYRENPPRAAQTLYQVARGCSDPVLASEVIAEMVPGELGEKIVTEFNRRLMKLWLRRCEP